MKVKLIRYTPNPESLVTSCAKLCYSPVGIDEIEESLTDDNIQKFLNKLVSMGHESPLEHTSFTFAVEEVSRVLSHQLVRHRIASYCQKSQRYVKEKQFDYIIPNTIKENDEATNRYYYLMREVTKCYNDLIKLGIPKEDARYVLPNACETKLVLTMNARSLLNFFRLRCCNRAQWEIRELADRMLVECKKVAPIIFSKAGPECVRTKCPEGSISCGNPRYELLKL